MSNKEKLFLTYFIVLNHIYFKVYLFKSINIKLFKLSLFFKVVYLLNSHTHLWRNAPRVVANQVALEACV